MAPNSKHPQSWDDDRNKCLKAPVVAKGQRLIILHAGDDPGFVNGAMVLELS
jgi:hypothetical protein